MMQLHQLADVVNGQFYNADAHALAMTIYGVSIDSRKDCTGQLFVALNGDRFDAHDFIDQVEQQGATAAIIEKTVDTALPCVLVNNSHHALSDLSAWWRSQFELPVVAITGSVGKTTVKEMLSSIFKITGKGLCTAGNLNNEIGVPLTLLRLRPDDNYAIVEMGMNHAGEISRLTQITQPTIALVNNAAAAHLEGLGNVESVAKAKGEIFSGLAQDGIAVINLDDSYANLWKKLAGDRRIITFGLNDHADVTANYSSSKSGLEIRIKSEQHNFTLSLKLRGQHSVMNVLASVAVAQAAAIPIESIAAGLTDYQPLSGRMSLTKVGALTLIDDSYNANPASMQAAIAVLAEFDDTTLIVGDMGELGESCEAEHRKLGAKASKVGIERMLAVGQYAKLAVSEFNATAQYFAEPTELVDYLTANPIRTGVILVKGSRSAKMENIVKLITRLESGNDRGAADKRVGDIS